MSKIIELAKEKEKQEKKILSVMKIHYEESGDVSYDELFDGFDELKVVTYSYDLDFIEEISKKFENMTVLLGCDKMVRGDVVPVILSSQKKSICAVRKHQELVARAMDGDVTFKVASRITSHQKIYILTAKDGRNRVIFGSANFSRRAFSGIHEHGQGEIIAYEDNNEALVMYCMSMYDLFEEFSWNDVPLETLYGNRDLELPEVPFAKEILVKNLGVVIEKDMDAADEAEYVTDVSQLAGQYAKVMPKFDRRAKTVQITPAHVHEMIKNEGVLQQRKKEELRVYPKLHVDYATSQVSFNGKEYDLKDMDKTAVKRNLEDLQEYFDGFDGFIGDIAQTKQAYYKLLNFMFLSPFMAMLRYVAHETGFAEEYFPYFAVLNGRKSAGKTQFVKTIQKLMTGADVEPAPYNTLTRTNMFTSLREIEGMPICLDDVPRDYFNANAGAIVKCDGELYVEKVTHHGTYIITTNEIETIKPEMAKRMYYTSVSATQTNTDSVAKKKKMTAIRNRFTTDLYRAYLGKMLPHVENMMARMKNFNVEADADWQPDTFKISSEVLLDLFRESETEPPEYVKTLAYEDYFGYNIICENMRRQIVDDWHHNPEAFDIQENRNILEYNAGERAYEATRVCDMLPEVLEAKRLGTKVVMKLGEARKFFSISFQTDQTSAIRSELAGDWLSYPERFETDKRHDLLMYDCGDEEKAERICAGLPEELEVKQHGSRVSMKLDETEKLFGWKFKKRRKGLFS